MPFLTMHSVLKLVSIPEKSWMVMFCFVHETPISVTKFGLCGLQATQFGKQEQRWGTIGNKIGFAEQKEAGTEQAGPWRKGSEHGC